MFRNRKFPRTGGPGAGDTGKAHVMSVSPSCPLPEHLTPCRNLPTTPPSLGGTLPDIRTGGFLYPATSAEEDPVPKGAPRLAHLGDP